MSAARAAQPAPLLASNPTEEDVDFHPTYTNDQLLEWIESVLDPVISEEIGDDDEDGEEAFMSLFEECFKLKNGKTSQFFAKAGVLFWRPNKDYKWDGYYTKKMPTQYAADVDIDFGGKTHYWATPYTTTGEDDEPVVLKTFETWGVVSKETLDLYADSRNFRSTIKEIIGSGVGGRIIAIPNEDDYVEEPAAESSEAVEKTN